MATKKSSNNRINFGFALIIVFLLVLFTNQVDKKHFATVQSTLVSIHNDRVLAQDYVYKMSKILFKKENSLLKNDTLNIKMELNKQFYILIEDFYNTKLTIDESKTLHSVREKYKALENIEKTGNTKLELMRLNELDNELDNLAEIQVAESKNLIGFAQKSLDSNTIMSNLEIAILIILGILLQILILQSVKKSAKKEI